MVFNKDLTGACRLIHVAAPSALEPKQELVALVAIFKFAMFGGAGSKR